VCSTRAPEQKTSMRRQCSDELLLCRSAQASAGADCLLNVKGPFSRDKPQTTGTIHNPTSRTHTPDAQAMRSTFQKHSMDTEVPRQHSRSICVPVHRVGGRCAHQLQPQFRVQRRPRQQRLKKQAQRRCQIPSGWAQPTGRHSKPRARSFAFASGWLNQEDAKHPSVAYSPIRP